MKNLRKNVMNGNKAITLFFLFLIFVGLNKIFPNTTSASVEGILVHQIHNIHYIKPTAKNDKAWGWSDSKTGLFIISPDGTITNEDAPLLKGKNIKEVYPAKVGDGTWVIASNHWENQNFARLYFIPRCVKNVSHKEVDGVKITGEKVMALAASENRAWFSWRDENDQLNHGCLNGEKITRVPYLPPIGYFLYRNSVGIGDLKIWEFYYPSGRGTKEIPTLISIDIDGKSEEFSLLGGSPYWLKFRMVKILPFGNRLLIISLMGLNELFRLPKGKKYALRPAGYRIGVHLFHQGNFKQILEDEIYETRVILGDEVLQLYPINEERAWIFFQRELTKFSKKTNLLYIDAKKNTYWKDTGIFVKNVFGVNTFNNGLWAQDQEGLMLLTYEEGKKFEKERFSYLYDRVPQHSNITSLVQTNNGNSIWVKMENAVRYISLDKKLLSAPILRDHNIAHIFPDSSGENSWLKSRKANYGIFVASHPGKEKVRVTITFGKDEIDSSKNKWEITYGNVLKTPRIKLDWQGIDDVESEEVRGRIHLSVSKNGESNKNKSGKKDTPKYWPAFKKGTTITFDNNPFKGVGVYTLKLHYKDDYGSNLNFNWTDIHVELPFFENPHVRTILFSLLVFMAALLGLWFPKLPDAYRGWLFSVVLVVFGPGISTVLEKKLEEQLLVLPLMHILLLFLFLGILLFMGAIKSTVFRRLAQTQPFTSLCLVASRLPKVRKHLFSDHNIEMKQRIKAERKRANSEKYFPIPASFLFDLSETETKSDPATYIVKQFLKPQKKPCPVFLIESVGGSGKSALARQIMELLLENFKKTASGPLPIYITDVQDKDIVQQVEENLGKAAISSEFIKMQLESGDFVIVIDNLHEEKIEIEKVRSYIYSAFSKHSPLLCISRHHQKIHQLFEEYPHSFIIQLLSLDDQTLDSFVKHYRARYNLPPQIRSACRGRDGTYSPLLIRLALLGETESVSSVSEIYESALVSLLKLSDEDSQSDDILNSAFELCLKTYWKDGARTIGTVGENRDTIRVLLKAGILLSVDKKSNTGYTEPGWVRFFHDSIQSYLTARALFDKGKWDSLEEAAGAPRFTVGELDQDGEVISELFMMCLEVFGPPAKLASYLKKTMETWAGDRTFDEKISKSAVLDVLPTQLKEKVRKNVGDSGTSTTLRGTLKICKSDTRILGRLFANLAPQAYSIFHSKKE